MQSGSNRCSGPEREADELRQRIAELERELAAERERGKALAAITDNALDSVFCKNTDRRYTFVNPAMERVLGLPAEKILGRAPAELFRPEDAAIVDEVDLPVLRGETVDEVRTLVIGGREVTFHTVQFPLRDRSGAVSGICGFVRDVTAKKRAEDALRESYEDLERRVAERTADLSRMNQDLLREMRVRRRIEEALRETEALQRTLLVNLPEIILLVDREGVIRFVNHVRDTSSTRIDEVIGRSLLELAPAAERERVWRETEAAFETGLIRRYEIQYDTDDLFAVTLLPVPAAGEPQQLIMVANRITEQRHTVEALRESESFLEAIIDNIPDTVFVKDAKDLRYMRFNRAGEDLVGLAREELIGRTDGDLFPPVEAESFAAKDREVLVTGKLVDIATEPVRTRHKGTRFVHTKKIPIFGPDGAPQYLLGISEDVTERRQAEQALRDSEKRFRALFETVPHGLAVTAQNGKILDASPALVALLGYSVAELLRMNILELIPEPFHAAEAEAVRRLMDEGSVLTEMELRRKDGTAVPVARIGWVVSESPNRPLQFGSVFQDLTEQRRIADERGRIEEQLRQAQKMQAIGQLAGGVAHDFNNILMGVVGNASLIQRRIPEDSPLYAKVQAIGRSAEQAVLLTNQLLAFARGGKYQPVVLDLVQAVENAVDFLPSPLKQQVRIAPRPRPAPCPVEADSTQIIQVVTNLCTNASEALGGRGRIHVDVRPAQADEVPPALCKAGARWHLLSVADDGPGIPEEHRERIFDPFYTSKDFGRGLGLAAVWGIAHNHRGTVVCRESASGGARFDVLFPAHEGAIAPRRRPVDEVAVRPADRDRTLIVVDDNPASLEIAVSLIETLGLKALATQTGDDAASLLERNRGRIDGALLDAIMPDADGVEVYARLRTIEPGLRAIFMSGYSEELALPRGAVEEGAVFLSKPFDLKALARAITRCFG